jgi:deoxyribodipyrimidine photolyase-related protein
MNSEEIYSKNILGTKPYAASGAYINRMSNYCKKCEYKVTEKNGSTACPFNYLYWNFLINNKDVLRSNHRMSMIYRVLDKFDDDKVTAIKEDSLKFLQSIV